MKVSFYWALFKLLCSTPTPLGSQAPDLYLFQAQTLAPQEPVFPFSRSILLGIAPMLTDAGVAWGWLCKRVKEIRTQVRVYTVACGEESQSNGDGQTGREGRIDTKRKK